MNKKGIRNKKQYNKTYNSKYYFCDYCGFDLKCYYKTRHENTHKHMSNVEYCEQFIN